VVLGHFGKLEVLGKGGTDENLALEKFVPETFQIASLHFDGKFAEEIK
jgi:hypothetical protein